MRKRLLNVVLSLLLAVGLAGCGGMFVSPTDIKVTEGLSATEQAIEKSINTARVYLVAGYNVVARDYAEQILTQAEALHYIGKLDEFDDKLQAIERLRNLGDLTNARSQAELLQQALLLLQREIAAKARKEKP
jgi:hypothetical protein